MADPKPTRRRRFWGGFLIVVGVVFLLDELFHTSLLSTLWPVAIIAVGVSMIFGESRGKGDEANRTGG
jgi:uncharacterized membrane protein HdeD (DUF308 family)